MCALHVRYACDPFAIGDMVGGSHLSEKQSKSKQALKQLADTYWKESISPIQIRIAELNALIKTEKSKELKRRLRDRRNGLNKILMDLQKIAVHLDQYYTRGMRDGGVE